MNNVWCAMGSAVAWGTDEGAVPWGGEGSHPPHFKHLLLPSDTKHRGGEENHIYMKKGEEMQTMKSSN